MKNLFVKTERQRFWLDQLATIAEPIKAEAVEVDEQSRFPFEAHRLLLQIGYPQLTLPKQYGGEGLSVYDMVLVQETLASYDENASLSLGWTLGVVGEIYETKLWTDELLTAFAEEIKRGAMINRAVSEAATGSPTRGGDQNKCHFYKRWLVIKWAQNLYDCIASARLFPYFRLD